MVGQRGQLLGQAPGLIAEQPRHRTGQQVVGCEQVDLPGAVRGEHPEAGGARPAYDVRGVLAPGHREVEERPDGRPDRLVVVRVDAVTGEHDGAGARGVGGAQSR